ncbi:MAG: hypothetical protein GX415_02505 [Chloroflexi bacterium]|jgi:hypothetical protein|nr:hypothetical protein [Anaerolineaceae bacterium]NLI44274.1 hypothetical protein [Chloroflexota bacterium]HOE34694.1 hypothetical protein [Anaerolineaceae bacterium]HOT25757.1 hypothetical protein [Anaerolineaceae bacterium]HQH57968.1 hypothetical protein [Anaerolineaceae bacterium]
MENIILQDRDIERRFSEVAVLFITEMDESSSAESLREEYARDKNIILHLKAAEDSAGQMLGFTRAAMSDYAYNLFTGADARCRGRKLGTAVRVLALRCARDVLKVGEARTHHHAANEPMLAIDRVLGYTLGRGFYTMRKLLT